MTIQTSQQGGITVSHLSRRDLMKIGGVIGTGAVVGFEAPSLFQTVNASVQLPKTALPGTNVTKFASPLSTFFGQRVSGSSLQVDMFEFQQNVLPDSFYTSLGAPFHSGTFLWGYAVGQAGTNPRPQYPGMTIEAHRGTPTSVRFVNDLPGSPVLRQYLTVDQTIHWADPLQQGMQMDPFTGPIPTVVHLHGAETQSTSDGVPEAWFTNNGLHGKGYFTAASTSSNAAVYSYPNGQQATTLWFHDHSLGITRINVFSGLSAFYFIRDQFDTGRFDNPLGLPAHDREIELMIQDRQFDTNGQLLFPASASNPSLVDGPPSNLRIHPFWIPEPGTGHRAAGQSGHRCHRGWCHPLRQASARPVRVRGRFRKRRQYPRNAGRGSDQQQQVGR